MGEVIKEWVKNVFVIIIAISFVEILLPSGAMKKYIHFVFSLIIMAIILSPIAILLA